MQDVQCRPGYRPRATFPSRRPLIRLDHIFVSPDIEILETSVVSTPLARRASDHLPLLATVRDRNSVGLGKGVSVRVALGGGRSIKKKIQRIKQYRLNKH